MHVKDVNKGVRTFFLSAASRFNQANVSNEAIVISYYALLAIIPLMIFIGNLLPLLHLKASTVLAYIEMAIPRSIYQTLKPFIIQYLENGSSGGAASISGLISVWAASRGFNAMKRSLNVAYGVENSQGMLARRLFAFLFTAFLGVAFVLLFIIYSFGQAVLEYLAPLFNLPMDMIDTFNQVKWPTIMVGIFWIMVLLYAFIPSFALYLAGSSFCDVRMDGLDSGVFGIRQVFCQNRFELRNNRNRNCCFILAELYMLGDYGRRNHQCHS